MMFLLDVVRDCKQQIQFLMCFSRRFRLDEQVAQSQHPKNKCNVFSDLTMLLMFAFCILIFGKLPPVLHVLIPDGSPSMQVYNILLWIANCHRLFMFLVCS